MITLLLAVSFAKSPADPCLFNPLVDQKFGVDALVAAVETRNLNFEQVLCSFPLESRQQPILIIESLSAQGASPDAPRVVLTDPGNDTTPLEYAATFNGSKDHFGFRKFEIMKFNIQAPPDQQVQFLEIDCSKGRCRLNRNPELCSSCHGFKTDIPRALWDSKTFFPNNYGRTSIGGSLPNDYREASRMKKFVEIAESSESIYRFLPNLRATLDHGCNPQQIAAGELPEEKVQYRSQDACYRSSQTLLLRNNQLASRLAIHNRIRIAELIRRSPGYSRYRYPVAHALLCEEMKLNDLAVLHKSHDKRLNLPEFLDSDVKAKEVRFHVDQYLKRFSPKLVGALGEKELSTFLSSRQEPTFRDIADYMFDSEMQKMQWGDLDTKKVTALRYLFEGRGIDVSAWNMDLPIAGGFYRFQNGPEQLGLLSDLTLLGLQILKSDPGFANELGVEGLLKNLHTQPVSTLILASGTDFCQRLGKKSHLALLQLGTQPSLTQSPGRK